MSRSQAVQQVKRLIPKGQPFYRGKTVKELAVHDNRIEVMYWGGWSNEPTAHTVYLSSTEPRIGTEGARYWVAVESRSLGGQGLNVAFGSLEDARAFADTLYRLKQPANYAPPEDPVAEVAFAEEARRYRALKTKPALPEEARRFKVQAELALEQKRFDDAVNLYEDGLRVAPLWPEGHFNRALVLGELSRYIEAIRAMKKYLLLTPKAPDARAAQDRIYQWESARPAAAPQPAPAASDVPPRRFRK